MRPRVLAVLVVASVAVAMPSVAGADVGVGPGGGTPGTSSNFTLVGADPLFGRGMNAAITVFDHYLYVGNRTDGSSRCGRGAPRAGATGVDSCPHPHPGVLVVDVADPAHPAVVGEFGEEFVTGRARDRPRAVVVRQSRRPWCLGQVGRDLPSPAHRTALRRVA